MALETPITVQQNDHGYNLGFTLNDSSGAPVDITGATLALKVQQAGTNSLKFTGNLTIDSGPAGTCHYAVQTTDFDAPGKYYAQIVATIGSVVQTWANILITVQPALPVNY